MSGTLPDPMVDADADLRDFQFMPLDVLRLRDSDLASVENPEVFRCAVLSWCVSWHQIPAASLPNDDAALARLLGFGRDIKGWRKVRAAGGMRGWEACTDGRLYHPVVAEKALEAWAKKCAQRGRTARASAARWAGKNCRDRDAHERTTDIRDASVTESVTDTSSTSVTESVTESKGQGQGQGQGQGVKTKARARASPTAPDWVPPEAWQSWVAYRGKSLTAHAATLCINELDRLRQAGHDPRAVIEQSIRNGWRGLFEVKRRASAFREQSERQRVAAEIYGANNERPDPDERVIDAEAQRVA